MQSLLVRCNMIQSDYSNDPFQPQGHASLRGILFRELIAVGVKASGGDIIALGTRHNTAKYSTWHPPKGWLYEKISLPDGAHAQYLVPHNCSRKDVAILQIHGGAYSIGFLPIFQRRADKLARLGGNVPVLSLDYRLAPEHPYPAALEDSLQAIEWLKREKGIPPESVVAIGESAGAGLALAVSMRLRDGGTGSLKALVLMSPWADLTSQGDSYAARYHMDPMFGRILPLPGNERRTAVGKVYAGGHDLKDPYVSPVFGDYAGLPPMLIHVGEYEMLFDDAVTVYKKAVAAGVSAVLKVWPGMFHAFQLADAILPEARTSWREIGVFMRHYLT